MIHDAWTFAAGNARELRSLADDLETVDADIARDYASVGSKSESEFREMMAAESWLTPDAAIEAGLIDEIAGQAAGEEDAAASEAAARMEMQAEVRKAEDRLAHAHMKARLVALQSPPAPLH